VLLPERPQLLLFVGVKAFKVCFNFAKVGGGPPQGIFSRYSLARFILLLASIETFVLPERLFLRVSNTFVVISSALYLRALDFTSRLF